MKTSLAPARFRSTQTEFEQVLLAFDRRWSVGRPPDLARFIDRLDRPSASLIGALAKLDLQNRRDLGESVAARDYLERFPTLADDPDRALSLIYEEFCLREEAGEDLDPESFLERYPSWSESLASQIRVHQDLSAAIGKTPKTSFPKPGGRFEKFELDSILGQGGAAKVYLARDSALGGRRFVLKVSPNQGAEPSILGRLTHRYIIPVHSVAVESETGLRGLCMPYLPGRTLDEISRILGREGPPRTARQLFALIARDAEHPESIPPAWADFPLTASYSQGVAWIIWKLAEALAYAHDQQILHRDVKPANILLTLERGPQLLDFNLAHAPNSTEVAEVALRGGTLPYMAPEQLQAFLDPDRWESVGPQADLYALGLVFRELLTGRSPDRPNSRSPLPRAIREMLDRRALPSEPLRRWNRNVPHGLAAIVDRCLAYEPDRRFPDVRALADDLGRFLAGLSTKHVVNPSNFEAAANWMRRKQRGRKAILVVALLGPLVLWASGANHPSSQARRRAALDAYRQGQYQAAIADFSTAREAEPDAVDLMIYHALTLQQLGRISEANTLFGQAAIHPDSLKVIEAELKKTPGSITLLMAKAAAHHYRKELEKEIQSYQQVLKKLPRYRPAIQGIVQARSTLGNYLAAIEQIQAVLTDIRGNQGSADGNEMPTVEELADYFETGLVLVRNLRVVEKVSDSGRELDRLLEHLPALSSRFRKFDDFDFLFRLVSALGELEQVMAIGKLGGNSEVVSSSLVKARTVCEPLRIRRTNHLKIIALRKRLMSELDLLTNAFDRPTDSLSPISPPAKGP